MPVKKKSAAKSKPPAKSSSVVNDQSSPDPDPKSSSVDQSGPALDVYTVIQFIENKGDNLGIL
jgi:hypothetical protein